MGKIKLDCQESNHICDKNQYKEAGLWECIKLTIHLIYCRACRAYTKRNNKLTKLVKNAEVQSLEVSKQKEIKEVFDKALTKQNQ